MNAIAIHPFRAWTLAVFLVSSVGQSVLAQVNDDFVDRIVLDSILPVSASGSNVGATVEFGESAHVGDFPESSVWWEWTALTSGTVQIDTFGSDFDTRLAIYTDVGESRFPEIASNDQATDGEQSRVRFAAVMGTTYYIAVDGFSGSEGNIELMISMAPPGPANDNFEDRITLTSVVPTSIGGSNVNASVELAESDHAGNIPESSVWWEWRARFSGAVQIATFGSDFNTELAVYTGMNLAELSEIASNDQAVGGGQSRVIFSATRGTTYHIAVDGYAGSEGDIALTIGAAPPERPNDNFEDRITLPSTLPTSTNGSNLGTTSELDEPVHARHNYGRSSVWWKWTAPSSGTVQIDTFGSDFNTKLAVYTGMALATLRGVASNDEMRGRQSRVRFSAVMGTTYQVAVDGYSGDGGNIALTIGMVAPGPPNDNFSDRIALPSELSISTGGSNVNASVEVDEPADTVLHSSDNSVWWEWTAPFSGEVQIDTFGSDVRAELAVYTGKTLATLSEIASDWYVDYYAAPEYQRVRFSVVKGTTYQIAVDGYKGSEGTIALTIAMPGSALSNDNFADRIALPSVLPISTSGDSVNATAELNEPAHTGLSAESSVWWEWTAPSSGPVQIDTIGSDFDTKLGVYTGMALGTLSKIASNDGLSRESSVQFSAVMGTTYQIAVDGHSSRDEGNIELTIGIAPLGPPNDNFLESTTLPSVLPISTVGSNVNASAEFNEPGHSGSPDPHRSVWWTWTAPSSGAVQIDMFDSGFDAELAVYVGMDLATLSKIASTSDTGFGPWPFGSSRSSVRFSAVKGTTYQIAVDGSWWNSEGNIELAISMVPPGPANDNFEDRVALPSELPTSTGGSNVNASIELNEPAHAGGSAKRSVWWEWMAPSSGEVQIDTIGSDFDTKLAVYTGMDLATLSNIVFNGDVATSEIGESSVRFSAVMGMTYQIAVGSDYLGGEGNLELNVGVAPPTPPAPPAPPVPPNDNFEDRVALPSELPTSTGGSNVNASVELDEPAHNGYSPEDSSVWWEWMAPSSGTVQIDTFGSDFDTILAVYTGTDLASLREMASNDDTAGEDQSRVRFSAVMGTTYQIAVDGNEVEYDYEFFAGEGNIVLNVSMAPPGPPNDNFADRIALPSALPTSTVGSNVNASIEHDEPDHAARSVWWEWTAPSSGTVQIDTFGSDIKADLAVYTGMDLATLREVASNSNDYWDSQSRVRFLAVMGTTYQIAVDSDDPDREGTIELTISMAPPGPPNDNFVDRIVLPSELPTSTGGSNVNASVELDEPAHDGYSPISSVWWEWTAPSSGLVQIDTFGSDFNTELVVYTGMTLATLSEIASDDYVYDVDGRRVRFFAMMGMTYQIAVNGFFRYDEGEGQVSLNIGMGSSPSVIQ